MGDKHMKKLKWYGIIFALFILFLYIMGTYDIFEMLNHNEAYYESKIDDMNILRLLVIILRKSRINKSQHC